MANGVSILGPFIMAILAINLVPNYKILSIYTIECIALNREFFSRNNKYLIYDSN
jgi:hypothetical protein